MCDRAHEELDAPSDWLHWSIPDPVGTGTKRAFDTVLAELDSRITAVAADAAHDETARKA